MTSRTQQQQQAAEEAAAAAAELLKMSSSDSIYGKLSNFKIDRKIGKGQFSVVYRAECKVDRLPVALKKVQIFEMMDAKARLDCMKEIQLLQVVMSIDGICIFIFCINVSYIAATEPP